MVLFLQYSRCLGYRWAHTLLEANKPLGDAQVKLPLSKYALGRCLDEDVTYSVKKRCLHWAPEAR